MKAKDKKTNNLTYVFDRGHGNRNAAKLTVEDVRLIKDLIAHRDALKSEARTLTNGMIAEKFGVHVRTIDKISNHETWANVAR